MIRNIFYATLRLLHFDKWLISRISPSETIILSLHRVSNEEDFFWPPLKVSVFEKLVEYSVRNFEIVALNDVAEISYKGSRPRLVFSFDDGYKDFFETALPILIKYKIPCNHNIVPECVDKGRVIWTQKLNFLFQGLRELNYEGHLEFGGISLNFKGAKTNWKRLCSMAYNELLNKRINRDELLDALIARFELNINLNSRMMTWNDIRLCCQNGVDVGSHTLTHTVLTTCNRQEIIDELAVSKSRIEDELGLLCNVLAFPNGKYDVNMLDICKKVGYDIVLLVDDETQKMHATNERPLMVSRINMHADNINELIFKVLGLQSFIKRVLRINQ